MLGRLVRENRDRWSHHRGDAQVESPLMPLKGAEGGIDSECLPLRSDITDDHRSDERSAG